MTTFINAEAASVARTILQERREEVMRGQVADAVAHLSDLFTDAGDGSVFSFARELGTRTYHFAAIKSGGKWYSTGSKTALVDGTDDDLVAWLIGLEIYKSDDLLALAKTKQPVAIEATTSDADNAQAVTRREHGWGGAASTSRPGQPAGGDLAGG